MGAMLRIAIVVLSLAAAGFLVVAERSARAGADIQHTALSASGTPSPQEIAAARSELATATRWTPDTDPIINLGVVYARAGQARPAGARFAAVTRKEPENAQAWSLLAFAADRYDSDLAATARARARALEPPVPRAR
jgi:Flp pilus assembly protein TadD